MVSKILGALGVTIGYLIGIGLTVLWVIGSIHAGKKHDEALLAWIAFPWGMYRGAEKFWHDDYANVDWNKRLADDTRSALYLVSESTSKNGNVVELNNSIEQFSNKIMKYPEEKIEYIKTATKAFIYFNTPNKEELFTRMSEYFKTGQLSFKLNDSTAKYRDILIHTYKLNDLIDPIEMTMKQQLDQMKQELSNDTSSMNDFRDYFYKNLNDEYILSAKIAMSRTYKSIFNEDLVY